MAINFSSALGIHEPALKFRAQRAQVLANNIANSDTPHFKARDLNFNRVFSEYINRESMSLKMAVTDATHNQSGSMAAFDKALLYRVPNQPSVDGNTVDEHIENSAYMENALNFQSSFTFLNSKFRGLLTALRGE